MILALENSKQSKNINNILHIWNKTKIIKLKKDSSNQEENDRMSSDLKKLIQINVGQIN